ncbi:MAG TPA: Uma2 family endonuclease [Chloroflexota bacterium]|nr:Uma2 family endonuclease [Chloroflexota bacterium]
MPSTEHGRSQRVMCSILEGILPEDDIVAVELMMLLDRYNWNRHLTPDLFVALGVGPLDPVYGVLRRQYRLWDEGHVPDLVYEAASPSTFARDSAGKKDDYAALGVREYVQFDPVGGLLDPRLQVFRLGQWGVYEPVQAEADGTVHSVTLPRYDWIVTGYLLRLRDRVSGTLVPTPLERAAAEQERADLEAERADAATARANIEAERANLAELETARLRAELARLRGDFPTGDL